MKKKVKGRPRKFFDLETIKNIFENHVSEIIVDGKVAPPKHTIWNIIKKRYNLENVTLKSLYADASRWWKSEANVDISTQNDSELTKNAESFSDENSASEENSEGSSENSNGQFKDQIRFALKIPKEEWNRAMHPIRTEYKRNFKSTNKCKKNTREYIILKPSLWSYLMQQMIARNCRDIPCL